MIKNRPQDADPPSLLKIQWQYQRGGTVGEKWWNGMDDGGSVTFFPGTDYLSGEGALTLWIMPSDDQILVERIVEPPGIRNSIPHTVVVLMVMGGSTEGDYDLW